MQLCPSCGARDHDLVSVTFMGDVWAAWKRLLRVDVPRALAPPAPETVSLLRCRNCQVLHFDPMLPGPPEFYAFLDSTGRYYEPEKWEFRKATELLAEDSRVLDVGCGPGRFLELAAERVREAVGIDSNPTAVAALRDRGLDAMAVGLTDLPPAAFDTVCAFQVLEHVESPPEFLRSLLSATKPGGTVLLSVPNADRLRLGALDPYDFPPHHVTRWTVGALRNLVDACDAEFEHVWFEPPDVAAAAKALGRRAAARRRGGKATTTSPTSGSPRSSWTQWSLLRRLRYGHTLLAQVRRR